MNSEVQNSFLRTQPINLQQLKVQSINRRGRTKSTDIPSSTLHTNKDCHKKLYLRQFDYGKLNPPHWLNAEERISTIATQSTVNLNFERTKQYGISGCTTSRESVGAKTHRERGCTDQVYQTDTNERFNKIEINSKPSIQGSENNMNFKQENQINESNCQNQNPNLPRLSLNIKKPRKVESTIKTTLKDKTVITNIINRYQSTKVKMLRN